MMMHVWIYKENVQLLPEGAPAPSPNHYHAGYVDPELWVCEHWHKINARVSCAAIVRRVLGDDSMLTVEQIADIAALEVADVTRTIYKLRARNEVYVAGYTPARDKQFSLGPSDLDVTPPPYKRKKVTA